MTKSRQGENAAELDWLGEQRRSIRAGMNGLKSLALAGLFVTLGLYATLALAVSDLLVAGQWPSLFTLSGLIALIAAQWLLAEGRLRTRRRLAQQLTGKLAEQVFAQGYDKGWVLLRRHSVSAWHDLLTKRLKAVEHFLIDYELQRWLAAVMPMLVLLLVWPISWMTGTLLLITLPLMPLFMWIVGVGAAQAQRRHFTALDRLGAFFMDRLKGASTLWTLNQSEAQLQRFRLAHRELEQRTAEVVRLAFLSASVLDFLATLSVALVAVYIGFSLLGELNFGFWGRPFTLGTALFLLLLTPAFFAELKAMGKLYHARADAIAAAEELAPILSQAPVSDANQTEAPFEHLTATHWQVLGYEGDVIIDGPALQLQRGDRVWLQGPSGSGKSALIDALMGLRPIGGDWQLNGSPVRHLKGLSGSVALLTQRPVLLPGTVLDNIGLGRVDRHTAEQAIDAVGLTDWLAQQPQGLDTELGEHPPLSGGQAQRLAIARLWALQPELVLLDEPTAHLSEHEHRELVALLEQRLADTTLVWVSHRTLNDDFFNRVWHADGEGRLHRVAA
ncbi:ABC transporter ATP-binding protein/permease [Saccharospirillum mangrovi]|uniref:ABC transporter ATP-binding protein/permease n=1 Tax=Saccharospirillum mangrovi TaxID=2161747 RepID=UPI000D3BE195|nr:ATP-binding cassette domain-containing protein [Saccharospirillum mangrovi]